MLIVASENVYNLDIDSLGLRVSASPMAVLHWGDVLYL